MNDNDEYNQWAGGEPAQPAQCGVGDMYCLGGGIFDNCATDPQEYMEWAVKPCTSHFPYLIEHTSKKKNKPIFFFLTPRLQSR